MATLEEIRTGMRDMIIKIMDSADFEERETLAIYKALGGHEKMVTELETSIQRCQAATDKAKLSLVENPDARLEMLAGLLSACLERYANMYGMHTQALEVQEEANNQEEEQHP